MNRLTKIAALSITLLLFAAPALAAEPSGAEGGAAVSSAEAAERPFIFLGAAFGSGLVILGAAYGISKIGSCAVESMARQPEVAGNIQTAMIISAALIEGVTFFALLVCILKT